jgi:hypothetical protein
MDLSDFDDADPDPDLMDMKLWSEVPQPIRKIVEQHVAAQLPAQILAKLRDLHARGLPISSDPAFFHFGGGMSVRNLCRQRLGDRELAAYCPFGGILTVAISVSSPRSPRRRAGRRLSAGRSRGNSNSVSSSPNCRAWTH